MEEYISVGFKICMTSAFLTQSAAKATKDEVHLLMYYIEISNNTKHSRWVPIQIDRGREILLKTEMTIFSFESISNCMLMSCLHKTNKLMWASIMHKQNSRKRSGNVDKVKLFKIEYRKSKRG